jgi:hypothetical protein
MWPVFVALAAFLPAAAMGAVALAVPFVLARLASPSDPLHGRPAEVLPRSDRLLLTPGFIAASSAATSAVFAGIALSGAALSRRRTADRLRLRPSSAPAPRVAVLAAGVLAASLGTGAVLSLLGADGKGFLGDLNRSFAGC